MSDYERKKHEQAFGRGLDKGKRGGFWDDLAREVGKAIGTVVPDTTEHQSEERGYEEGRRRRAGW